MSDKKKKKKKSNPLSPLKPTRMAKWIDPMDKCTCGFKPHYW